MSGLLTGLLVGLLVSFIAWAAKSIVTRRQIYLIQPKLFDYSDLGGGLNAKTVEIVVINAGRRVEEDVRVQFAPGFNYTVVASGVSGLGIVDGVLKIDRLTPKQEVTVILYAEGGEFRKDHISGITSKEVVGKIKASIQEAKNTPAQAVFAFVLFFFVLMPIGYGLGKFIEIAVWPQASAALFSRQALDYTVTDDGTTSSYGVDKSLVKKVESAVSIEKVERGGDYVYIVVEVNNGLSDRMGLTLTLTSPVHDKRSEFSNSDYFISDAYAFPGKSRNFLLGDYLPADVSPQEIYLEVAVEYKNERIWLKRNVHLDRSKGA